VCTAYCGGELSGAVRYLIAAAKGTRAGMRTLSLLTATHNSTPSPVRQPDSRTSTNARSHHVRCLHQALSSERQLAKLPPPNKLGSGLPQRSTLTTTSPPLASFYSQRIFSRTAAPPPNSTDVALQHTWQQASPPTRMATLQAKRCRISACWRAWCPEHGSFSCPR